MRSAGPLAALCCLGLAVDGTGAETTRPLIGILTMPNSLAAPFDVYDAYFPASYSKWIESGGGRAVPIPHWESVDYILPLLSNLNGFLFTGGSSSFFNKNGSLTKFATTAKLIFEEVVRSAATGETVPLWGTCLGHELVLVLAAGANHSVLTKGFDSENATWALNPTDAAAISRLWGSAPADAWRYLTTENITMNLHQAGVTPANFMGSAVLAASMTILSTNEDRAGQTFVSSSEGKSLPIYTVQFHPEKPPFEWVPSLAINHSYESIVGNAWTQRFFVNEARKNGRGFSTVEAENAALIYNHVPIFTATSDTESLARFEEVYVFYKSPPPSPSPSPTPAAATVDVNTWLVGGGAGAVGAVAGAGIALLVGRRLGAFGGRPAESDASPLLSVM